MSNDLEFHAKNNQFQIVDVKKDGNCFFHAVSLQWGRLRGSVLREYLSFFFMYTEDQKIYRQQYEDFFNEDFDIYIEKLKKGEWPNEFTIRATADMLDININILNDSGIWTVIKPDEGRREGSSEVNIGHYAEVHYVSLDKIDDITFTTTSQTLSQWANKTKNQ